MRMNRRNVLAGIGALTAGGGAIFGSGAFSTVQADRNATIQTTADSSAFLALSPSGSTDLVSETDGTLELSFNLLNDNAVTTITPGFTIKNNGGSGVGVKIDLLDSNGEIIDSNDGITFESASEPAQDLESYPTANGDDHNLASNGSVDVNITIDTTGDTADPTNVDQIQITANEDEFNQA